MNIRDFRYLVALAEYRHFAKAAESCFISQPGLSMQIKKLEEYLGVKLLERTNKSVNLTECGISIAARARYILQQVDELKEFAELSQDPFKGEIRIGVFPTLAPYLLPHIIPKIAQAFPKLKIYLVEEQTAHLIAKLKAGKLHAAFLAMPVNEKNLVNQLLFEEEFLLAVPLIHPFAHKKMIKQSDLDGKSLLLLEEGHCLREQALALCQNVNANESQDFRATSLETLRNMVAANVGITLIPKLACQESDTLNYLSFEDPIPLRTIGLVWRTCCTKQIVLQEMVNLIKQVLCELKLVNVIH